MVVKIKKYIFVLAIVSLLVIAACSSQGNLNSVNSQPKGQPSVVTVDNNQAQNNQPQNPSDVKEFDMVAKQWSFEPSTITVNKGDKVKLNIKNEDVTHGFAIFEFGVNKNLPPGKTTIVEFTADKSGEYNFFCSVPCGSGHKSMKGKLIVK